MRVCTWLKCLARAIGKSSQAKNKVSYRPRTQLVQALAHTASNEVQAVLVLILVLHCL